MPGVRGTALATLPPLGQKRWTNRHRDGTVEYIHHVDASYFAVMGIPLRGRAFEPGEPNVAVISESLAQARWPGEEPLGKVRQGETVIGIAGNARTIALGDPRATEHYEPVTNALLPEAVLIVRVTGDPTAMLPALARSARAIDEHVAPSVTILDDAFDEKLATPRRMAVVISGLAGLALMLAAIGLTGLLAFSVSQRVRELAICTALGATPMHIAAAVLRQYLKPLACGLVMGLAGAAALSMGLRSELLGLSYLDPISYLGSALLFTLVVLMSAAGPLRRALRLQPMAALRCE
jgi:hypothetical protein